MKLIELKGLLGHNYIYFKRIFAIFNLTIDCDFDSYATTLDYANQTIAILALPLIDSTKPGALAQGCIYILALKLQASDCVLF